MKTIISLLIISCVFVLSLVVFQSRPVSACSYQMRSPQEMFASADVVFRGVVTARATSSDEHLVPRYVIPTLTSTTHFEVKTYWKGAPGKNVVVKSSMPQGFSCSPFVSRGIGTEYIVYAHGTTSTDLYHVSEVDVKQVSDTYVSADLAFLGDGKKPAQVTTVVTSTSSPKASQVVPSATPVVTTTNPPVAVTPPVEMRVDTDVEVSFVQKILSWFSRLFK